MSGRLLVLFALIALAIGAWFLFCSGPALLPGARAHTIVLITPDTLRWDHVSAYAPAGSGPPHPHTPHMDRLAAEGLRFADARTPAPLTLPAHTTMLAGLPPAVTGVRLNAYGRLPPRSERGFPLVQESLAENGFTTAAFVSAAVLGRRYGLEQGFDHYDDGGLSDLSGAYVQERPGIETVAAVRAYLGELGAEKPLFLWVHLFDPHAPHGPGGYAGDVETVDAVVGRLLDGLAAAGRGDAAILLAADHGEALDELRERTHGMLLADGVLRVPFLLRAPGLDPGVRGDPVELADVAPTLAALGGAPWPAAAVPVGAGRNLLAGEAPPGRVRVAETLYGHHLHRWAQLVAAQGPTGTLVDAGRERLHWVPPSGFQRVLPSTELPGQGDETRRLAHSIAEYKQLERPDRMHQGQVAGGYGGSGAVEGLLTPADNRELADPHASILAHYRLDAIKQGLLDKRLRGSAKAAEGWLGALEALDRPSLLGDSPELQFFLGEAHKILAEHPHDRAEHAPLARDAFLESFRMGRKDTQTLVRAAGMAAYGGKAQAGLDLLDRLVVQVESPGCQYWMLRKLLLEDLGRPAEAAAACEAGKPACAGPRERALWESTCR